MKIIVKVSYSDYQELDIPADTKLNIERNSPIFSTEASMTLPVSLPLTDNNRRILNFPDRLDIYSTAEESIRAMEDMDVIVIQGSWQQEARMSIYGCSENSIETTLYFDSSSIWSMLESYPETLPKVMKLFGYGSIPPAGADLSVKRRQLFNSLNNGLRYYRPSIEVPYASMLHPEESHYSFTREDWLDMWEERAGYLDWEEFVIAPLYTKDGWLNMFDGSGLVADDIHVLQLKETENFKNISVFLRLDYVLQCIFNMHSMDLEIDFSSAPAGSNDDGELEAQWKSIVVLNNTKDALYLGYIPYSALVPDISCKDFLAIVMAQFGCRFVMTSSDTVKMIFTQEILANRLGSTITSYAGKQIAFDSHPDYKPEDGMNDLKSPDIYLEEIDITGWGYTDRDLPILTPHLSGLCQRITTTSIDGNDATEEEECPVVFANIGFSFRDIQPTSEHVTYRFYYPVLNSNYIEHWKSDDSIGKIIYQDINEGSVYYAFNNRYNIIANSSDKVTISRIFTTKELIEFDFTKPLIISGRLLWPAKLQYELQDSDIHSVTMELIAPRKA